MHFDLVPGEVRLAGLVAVLDIAGLVYQLLDTAEEHIVEDIVVVVADMVVVPAVEVVADILVVELVLEQALSPFVSRHSMKQDQRD